VIESETFSGIFENILFVEVKSSIYIYIFGRVPMNCYSTMGIIDIFNFKGGVILINLQFLEVEFG
jgi:hypothetical protein